MCVCVCLDQAGPPLALLFPMMAGLVGEKHRPLFSVGLLYFAVMSRRCVVDRHGDLNSRRSWVLRSAGLSARDDRVISCCFLITLTRMLRTILNQGRYRQPNSLQFVPLAPLRYYCRT